MLNCIVLTDIFGGSEVHNTDRISPEQELAWTRGGHATGCEGTGAGNYLRRHFPHTCFSCSREVKGLKEQQKEWSATSSEELIVLTTPIIPRSLQAQTPHEPRLCAPEKWGHKGRDRAAQARAGTAQCLSWSCLYITTI